MQKLLGGLTLFALAGISAPAFGDAPRSRPVVETSRSDAYERSDRQIPDHQVSSPKRTPAEQYVYERACREAHQREARMERRRRASISLQRPIVSATDIAPEPMHLGWLHTYPDAAYLRY